MINRFLNKLEQKYGQYAIEGLMKYITGFMCLVFFLNKVGWLSYSAICLSGERILSGEIWRIITFALIPVSTNFLWLFFEILILFMCANGLESQWGSFKFTIYYFLGLIMISLSSIIVDIFPSLNAFSIYISRQGSYFVYLNLFLAFAYLYPNYEILLYFILPLKVKYVAWFSAILLFLHCLSYPILLLPFVMALGNFFIFFGFESIDNYLRFRKRQAYDAQFELGNYEKENNSRHKCSICGKTEISDPTVQFRYCTCDKCGKNGVCFCLEHLKEHKKANKE